MTIVSGEMIGVVVGRMRILIRVMMRFMDAHSQSSHRGFINTGGSEEATSQKTS